MLADFPTLPGDIKNVWSRALLKEMRPRSSLFEVIHKAETSPKDPRNACANAAAEHLGAKYLKYLKEQLTLPPVKAETPPECTLTVGTASEEKAFACVVSPSAFEILKNIGVVPMSESEENQVREIEKDSQQPEESEAEEFFWKNSFQAIRKMDPPVKVGDIRMCLAGKISHDSRLDKYTVSKAPVSYDNEVLRFQAMGMPPGGGENRDGWTEVHDVVYPLMARFNHVDGFVLECVPLQSHIIWRLINSNKLNVAQRDDLAAHESNTARAWAVRLILRLTEFNKADEDSAEDEDLDSQGFLGCQAEGRIHRKGQTPVRADQWPKELLEKYTRSPMDRQKLVNMDLTEVEHHVCSALLEKYNTYFPKLREELMACPAKFKINMIKKTPVFVGIDMVKGAGTEISALNDIKAEALKTIGLVDTSKFRVSSFDTEAHDDQVDALKAGTLLHKEIEKQAHLAAGYDMGKEGFKAYKAAAEKIIAERHTNKITGHRPELIICDDIAEDDLEGKHKAWKALYYDDIAEDTPDAPTPLQALTTREFKPGKMYVQVHDSARARAFEIDHTFPEEYLEDLEKLQGKFYEAKGFYPTCREYSLMNDLIIDAECIQTVYRIPQETR